MVVGFVVTGSDEAMMARKREWVRKQFAFLYSTPAYWPSLEHLGFGEVGRELHALSKLERWKEMERLVSDEMIEALVPQGRYADIAQILLGDYASLVDRITFPVPDDPDQDERVSEVVAELRGG
jgi:hypothetical protein